MAVLHGNQALHLRKEMRVRVHTVPAELPAPERSEMKLAARRVRGKKVPCPDCGGRWRKKGNRQKCRTCVRGAVWFTVSDLPPERR